MSGQKRLIVVGIPGVGKTTVIDRMMRISKKKQLRAEHVVFGTVMMQEAGKLGVSDRDQMRRLPVGEQKRLQSLAAERIGKMTTDLLVIDTHLFIKTGEGYMPGLPIDLLKPLAPTNMVLVDASVPEVLARRAKDSTRQRDVGSKEDVQLDKQMAVSMLGATGVALGVPSLIVENKDGEADKAAETVLRAVGVG
ncbi:MAG: adenylate kinase [Thaumarchaeota archaeon]|nr:adenylate kinase [Nitrososphaerota archaeon]